MSDMVRNLPLNALLDYVTKQCAVFTLESFVREPAVIIARNPPEDKRSTYEAIVIAIVHPHGSGQRQVKLRGEKARDQREALASLLVGLESYTFGKTLGR